VLHTPSVQSGVPFVLLHAALHAPQCRVLSFRSTSQPFSARSPSQFANPAWQAYWQAPSEHPVALVLSGASNTQFTAQVPQWLVSVFRSVSHPASAVQSP
jgi:hypothetical protein